MAENPAVSVIIPMYNAASILSRSLTSVQNQSLRNIEIICIDDGSTDDTLDELNRVSAQDTRIKVIHQENSGAGVARNAGLAVATGEYLSFLDADDIFKPNMLERLHAEAVENDLDIAVCRCDLFYPESGRYASCPWTIQEQLLPENYPFSSLDVESDLFKVFVGWPWDKLFKASFVNELGIEYQSLRTTNDMLFVFSAISKAQHIGYMHDVLIHHVKEEGTLSVTREKSWGCFYEALCALRDQLKQWGLFDRFERDYKNYCVHAALWNIHTLAEPTKILLMEKMKNEWADQLNIFTHDSLYFYNQGEYNELHDICTRGLQH